MGFAHALHAFALCVLAALPSAARGDLARADAVIVPSDDPTAVADLRGRSLADAQARPASGTIDSTPDERALRQHSRCTIGGGDFTLRATVTLDLYEGRGAGFVFDGGSIALDDPNWGAVLNGRLFGGGAFPFETERPASARPGAPVEIVVERLQGNLVVRINDFEMGQIGLKGFELGRVGFDLGGGALRVLSCSVSGDIGERPRPLAVFTGADGDIDEYRDPALATDGARLLVAAIAVSTREDGSTMQRVAVRHRDGDGAFGPTRMLELPDLDPDFIALGYQRGTARPWLLAVQPAAGNRLAKEIVVLDSADATSFAVKGRIDCSQAPVRLISGAMADGPGGAPWLGATRVDGGKPVAAALVMEGAGSIRPLVSEPSCDPILFAAGLVVTRTPGETTRTTVRGLDSADRSTTASTRFDGSAAIGAPIGVDRSALRIAQPDPGFPYPLREVASDDGGATWTRRSTVWGGAAGHATSFRTANSTLLLFEGGDKARREHVLLLELGPDQPATAVTSPTRPQPGSP